MERCLYKIEGTYKREITLIMGVDTVFQSKIPVSLLLDDLDLDNITEEEFWRLFNQGMEEELIKYRGKIEKNWTQDYENFYPNSKAHRGEPENWIPYILLVLRVARGISESTVSYSTHIPYTVVYAGTGAAGIMYISPDLIKLVEVDEEGGVSIQQYTDEDLDDEDRWDDDEFQRK